MLAFFLIVSWSVLAVWIVIIHTSCMFGNGITSPGFRIVSDPLVATLLKQTWLSGYNVYCLISYKCFFFRRQRSHKVNRKSSTFKIQKIVTDKQGYVFICSSLLPPGQVGQLIIYYTPKKVFAFFF